MKIYINYFRGDLPPEARHILMFHYVKRALKSSKIQYFYQKIIYNVQSVCSTYETYIILDNFGHNYHSA